VPTAAVTAALDLRLPDAALDESVRTGLAHVEGRLLEAIAQADRLAAETSRHLVAAGGKRGRPMLTLIAGHLGDPTRPEILEAAVVVELTHLATLYHDDVMDSAPLRRGAPSAHAVWGNTVAILTGDLLFARASRVVSELGVEAVRLQATTFERLCLGQLHETVGPGPDDDPVEHYLQVLSTRPVADRHLRRASGRCSPGAPPRCSTSPRVRRARRRGLPAGRRRHRPASDGATSGKTPGHRPARARAHAAGAAAAPARRAHGDGASRELLERLDGDLSDDARLAETVALLREHPATAQARREACAGGGTPSGRWNRCRPSPARDALRAFATAVVDRTA
jgi:heptaprenyl diphosphate synthase